MNQAPPRDHSRSKIKTWIKNKSLHQTVLASLASMAFVSFIFFQSLKVFDPVKTQAPLFRAGTTLPIDGLKHQGTPQGGSVKFAAGSTPHGLIMRENIVWLPKGTYKISIPIQKTEEFRGSLEIFSFARNTNLLEATPPDVLLWKTNFVVPDRYAMLDLRFRYEGKGTLVMGPIDLRLMENPSSWGYWLSLHTLDFLVILLIMIMGTVSIVLAFRLAWATPEKMNLVEPVGLPSSSRRSRIGRWIRSPYVALVGIVLLAVTFRTPGAFMERGNHVYVDEALFMDRGLPFFRDDVGKVPHFLSGGMNFLIPKGIFKAFSAVTGNAPTLETLRLTTRLFATVLLASLSCLFVYQAAVLLGLSMGWSLFAALLLAISPLATSASVWFYPDGYMMFFSSVFLAMSVQLWSKPFPGSAPRGWLAFMIVGATGAALFSVKYSGLLILGFPVVAWLAGVHRVARSEGIAKGALIRTVGLGMILGVLAFITMFATLNPDVLFEARDFLGYLRVNHYNRHDQMPHGVLYLGIVLGLFGPGIFLICGILAAMRDRGRLMTLAWLLVVPLFVILYLGRLAPLFHRNLLFLLPWVMVGCALGLAALPVVGRMKILRPIVLGLGFALLIPLTLSQFLQDLRPDSRDLARQYLVEHGLTNQTWANSGAGQASVASHPLSPFPNYVVLDSWFGGMTDRGEPRLKPGEIATVDQVYSFHNVFGVRHLRNLHYLNHSHIFGFPQAWEPAKEFLTSYRMEKTFTGSGPAVFLFIRSPP